MTSAMIGALLLNFSGIVGVITMRAGRLNWSTVTYMIGGPLISVGTMASFLAIALFIRDQGIGYGLLYWVLTGLVLSFVASMIMDGFRSILGLVAAALGIAFGVASFL